MVDFNAVLGWLWSKFIWLQTLIFAWINPFLMDKGVGWSSTVLSYVLAGLAVWFGFRMVWNMLFD